VGDEAEIIFGAVHEPAMQGEIRVTVIATGFDRILQGGLNGGSMGTSFGGNSGQPVNPVPQRPAAAVLPFPASRQPGSAPAARPAAPAARPIREGAPPVARPIRPNVPPPPSVELDDMEIPTFIRRQMD
jgi:cell division protein FtsZ